MVSKRAARSLIYRQTPDQRERWLPQDANIDIHTETNTGALLRPDRSTHTDTAKLSDKQTYSQGGERGKRYFYKAPESKYQKKKKTENNEPASYS